MSRTSKLADDVSVSSFVTPDEMRGIAKHFRTIINNRPDGEEAAQASSAELEAAARQLGLTYLHIPVTPGDLRDEQIAAFRRALDEAPGATLAFCRTGTRSASLWALSQAGRRPTSDILAAAATAGFDLSALEPRLRQRAAGK